MSEPSLFTGHTDETVLQSVEMFEAVRDYEALLQVLHKDPSLEVSKMTLHDLFKQHNELLVFVEDSGMLVATAQATLAHTEPLWHVLVNNVVVHDDHQGKGHGRRVMQTLEQAIKVRWGGNGRKLQIMFTNSPSKGNAGFYQVLGYTARVPENHNHTVVWTKDI